MSGFQRPRNDGAGAIARLDRNRLRWSEALAKDKETRAASRPGLGTVLLGLNAQPWLSTLSALWLSWRRRDRSGARAANHTTPAPLPGDRARGGVTGLIKRHPLIAAGLVCTILLALKARRAHPPGPHAPP